MSSHIKSLFRPGARLGCVATVWPLILLAAAVPFLGCANRFASFSDSLRTLHDQLASAPAESEATATFRVTPGAQATLIFLPAATPTDYGTLRASGLSAELSQRMAAQLEYLGPRDRAMLVVSQSGQLSFSTAFADWADVTDVVFGTCSGRCRVTVRGAGPGIRPRVVKVG